MYKYSEHAPFKNMGYPPTHTLLQDLAVKAIITTLYHVLLKPMKWSLFHFWARIVVHHFTQLLIQEIKDACQSSQSLILHISHSDLECTL